MQDEKPEDTVRTSLSLPAWMKREMEKVDINWSAVLREAMGKRLAAEGERDRIEAVLINERLLRKAPEGWDSTGVIRDWRRRR